MSRQIQPLPEDGRLRALLPEGARFELTPSGFYGHRKELGRGAAYRSIERAMSGTDLRVFDFNMGLEDLSHNLHDGHRFRTDYRGAEDGSGRRIFRVDHHFEIAELKNESTTPMVLRWLLARHEAGDRHTISAVASARYLADHCDVDIIFSHHLASRAEDPAYLREVGPALAAGALINDYGSAPEGSDGRADRAYFGGLALEKEITESRLGFEEVQVEWLPVLGAWLSGDEGGERAARLAGWEATTREEEEKLLAVIDEWRDEGRLDTELGGRLAVLRAPEEIDNLTFFRYLARRIPCPGHRIQLLSFPSEPGSTRVTYKIRSHGGFDLNPLYPRLDGALPGAGFGGRSAAGGSGTPCEPDDEALLRVLRRALAP